MSSPARERRGAAARLSYLPQLDGVRALAVLAVMAFHGGIPWLVGGYLGVDTFFVLSGFLITTLLLGEWGRTQGIKLAAFWARRARRLLPGLLVLLLFVAAYAAFAVPAGTYPNLRLDALSTLLYVANWHFILIGSNYFNQTGLPSPLTHTWSLAIEEQFYLVWPLVVLVVLRVTRRLGALALVCAAAAIGSALEMALLFRAGASTSRLYYGTDTHAQCLLVGATLAVLLAMVARRRSRTPAAATDTSAAANRGAARLGRGDLRAAVGLVSGPHGWAATTATTRTALGAAGIGGVAATAVLWWRVDGSSPFLYQGGFLVASAATAAVLLCVVCVQRSPLTAALSVRPLRYLGRISYGVYLWHYPLFFWIDEARTGLTGYGLFGLRVAVTRVAATASYFLIEQPIRRGTFLRGWRAWVGTPAAATAAVAAVVVATMPPAAAQVPLAAPSVAASPLYQGPPVKVLIVGDSVALTLGIGLSEDAHPYDVVESNQAILGCGVTVGPEVKTRGTVLPVAYPCNSTPAPAGTPQVATTPAPLGRQPYPEAERWTAWYRHWVDTYHPDVVAVLAGRWEVVTRVYEGKWTNILHPNFAAYVRRQLARTVRLATSNGARAVLFTAPCFDTGEQPDGQPWPTSSSRRIAAYNRLVREVAAELPAKASVLNLDALACPGGSYHEFLDGVQVRRSDGVHFTTTGGRYLAPKIWPTIVAAGRAAMATPHDRSTQPSSPIAAGAGSGGGGH